MSAARTESRGQYRTIVGREKQEYNNNNGVVGGGGEAGGSHLVGGGCTVGTGGSKCDYGRGYVRSDSSSGSSCCSSSHVISNDSGNSSYASIKSTSDSNGVVTSNNSHKSEELVCNETPGSQERSNKTQGDVGRVTSCVSTARKPRSGPTASSFTMILSPRK